MATDGFALPLTASAAPSLVEVGECAQRAVNCDLQWFHDSQTAPRSSPSQSAARPRVDGLEPTSMTATVADACSRACNRTADTIQGHDSQLAGIFDDLNQSAQKLRDDRQHTRFSLLAAWQRTSAGGQSSLAAADTTSLLTLTSKFVERHRDLTKRFGLAVADATASVSSMGSDLAVRPDGNDEGAPVDQHNLRSILDEPGWGDPVYRQALQDLIAHVPPEGGQSGYGTIPAGAAGVLGHIYDTAGGKRQAAFIGDAPTNDNPESWYTPYAVARQLEALHDESGVRALVLTDFGPLQQAEIDHYLRSTHTVQDQQDLQNALLNSVPPGHSSGGQTWSRGMVEMIDAAGRNGFSVVAGNVPHTGEARTQAMLDAWNRVRQDTGGNALFFGSRFFGDSPTERLGIIGIMQYNSLVDLVWTDNGTSPLKVDPGQLLYQIGSDPEYVPTVDQKGGRGVVLWNTDSPGQ